MLQSKGQRWYSASIITLQQNFGLGGWRLVLTVLAGMYINKCQKLIFNEICSKIHTVYFRIYRTYMPNQGSSISEGITTKSIV